MLGTATASRKAVQPEVVVLATLTCKQDIRFVGWPVSQQLLHLPRGVGLLLSKQAATLVRSKSGKA